MERPINWNSRKQLHEQNAFSSLHSLTRAPASRAPVLAERHSVLRILAVLAGFFSVCLLLFFFIATMNDYGYSVGLYVNETRHNSSAKLDINSEEVLYYGTAVTYFWTLLWLVYALSTLCRSTELGPLYVYPSVLPANLFVLHIFADAAVIGKFLLTDRGHLEAACLMIWLAATLLFLCLAVAAYHLEKMRVILVRTGHTSDYWVAQLLVLNGLGFSAGFYMINAHVSLATVLSFGKLTSLSTDNSSRVALSVLSLLLLVYSVLDFFYLDKWIRYTVTPYLPVVAVLIAACVQNWELENVTNIFAAALLSTCLIGFFIKIIFVIARHLRGSPCDLSEASVSDSSDARKAVL